MGTRVKDAIRTIDFALIRCQYSDFYNDMSKVEDLNYFQQIIEQKNDEEKQKIEDGVIYLSTLTQKNQLNDYEILFLKKYHKYLINILEKDVRKYFNDKYCKYLYYKVWNSIKTEQESEETKFINGKSIKDIEMLLVDKYNKLMENVENGSDLENEDKKFIEEIFLAMAFNSIIYKEYDGEKDFMYDIVEFFKQYPIRGLSTNRDRQLNILSILASRMIDTPYNCGFSFDTDYKKSNDDNITLGTFFKAPNGISYIKINDMNEIFDEKEYLEKVFTIFHELGHLSQEYDKFNDEFKQVIEIEKYLLKNDREFYHKYHDSFCKEWDADNYAAIQLIKLYGEQYPELVVDIVDKQTNKKRVEWKKFYDMEQEKYKKKYQQEQTKADN